MMWLFIIQIILKMDLKMAAIVPQKMNAKGSTQGCARKNNNNMIAFAELFIYFHSDGEAGSLKMINSSSDSFEMLVVISFTGIFFFFNIHSLYTHLMLPSVL